MNGRRSIGGGCIFLAALGFLSAARPAVADPPTPVPVLLVANGYYVQETQIEQHLLATGAFSVTRIKDYKLKSTTNLEPYDLVILTEFAPNASSSALAHLESSGLPILIVEYWDCWYSYRLGLTATDACGYVGRTTVEPTDESLEHPLSRLGAEVQVYSSSYTIYGADEADLEPGVVPLAWSSRSFGELAVFWDPERRIAATGIYDTRKFTTDGWRLFDMVLGELVPVGPRWSSGEEALAAYVESGLYDYIDGLTGSEPREQVIAEAWRLVFGWNLFPILHIIDEALTAKGPYRLFLFFFGCPEQLQYDEVTHPNLRWMLGEHQVGSGESQADYTVPKFGTYLWGVDLGPSVSLGNRTLFYMGDTWGWAGRTGWYDYPPPLNDEKREVNDSITELAWCESAPENGITVFPIKDDPLPESQAAFLPQTIPGVHRDHAPDVWYTEEEEYVGFSVPTGVSASSKTIMLGDYPLPVTQVRLWYGTQITRPPGEGDTHGKSWVGCSIDGTTFNNCYSGGGSGLYAYFSDNRFIQVAPVEVTAAEVESMGAAAPPHTAQGGTLLFGVGHPYRCSPLYLAYVDRQYFGTVDANLRPVGVWYYNAALGWKESEEDATPIIEPNRCLVTEEDFSDFGLDETWDEMVAITRARTEEWLWTKATGPVVEDEQIPGWFESTGCDYTDPETTCDSGACYQAMYNQDLEFVCLGDLCDEPALNSCLDSVFEDVQSEAYPWPVTSGFGELSVKLVKDGSFSRLVMLSNHPIPDWDEKDEMLAAIVNGVKVNPITPHPDGFDTHDYRWNRGGIYFRSARLEAPWDWSEAEYTGTPGYGPYIIDRFTEVETIPAAPGGMDSFLLTLLHTTSVWNGELAENRGSGIPGAYGVYTTRTMHVVQP
jgi:hypothetical protein